MGFPYFEIRDGQNSNEIEKHCKKNEHKLSGMRSIDYGIDDAPKSFPRLELIEEKRHWNPFLEKKVELRILTVL